MGLLRLALFGRSLDDAVRDRYGEMPDPNIAADRRLMAQRGFLDSIAGVIEQNERLKRGKSDATPEA